MNGVIDLSLLPPPNVVEQLDFDTIFDEVLNEFIALTDGEFTALVESDPAYKILQVAAYRELLLRQRINDDAVAVMLAHAEDEDLDNIAANWNIARFELFPEDTSTIPPTPAVYESDDALRERVLLSMQGQTNAGSEGAYIYQTRNADPQVKDCKPIRTDVATITVTVLSHDGDGTPSDELIDAVTAHLMQPHVRQMTDEVLVQKAQINSYAVRADMYVQQAPGADHVIENARLKAQQFVESCHKLGVRVPVSGIYAALNQEGVSRVVLHEPTADIVPEKTAAAFCRAIELTQMTESRDV